MEIRLKGCEAFAREVEEESAYRGFAAAQCGKALPFRKRL